MAPQIQALSSASRFESVRATGDCPSVAATLFFCHLSSGRLFSVECRVVLDAFEFLMDSSCGWVE
jgi:hypothetical protein